jgi:hypothetical protein
VESHENPRGIAYTCKESQEMAARDGSRLIVSYFPGGALSDPLWEVSMADEVFLGEGQVSDMCGAVRLRDAPEYGDLIHSGTQLFSTRRGWPLLVTWHQAPGFWGWIVRY